jgi:dTDP-glucose 4,6-dehydratase
MDRSILYFTGLARFPRRFCPYPDSDSQVGALGTHNALGLARAKGAGLLMASTSEVYGDPLVHPQEESYFGNVNPIGPRGCYDEAKRFAEAIVMAITACTASTPKSCASSYLRAANAAGRRAHRAQLPDTGAAGRTDDVYGEGTQTRSFCYVSDLVDGIIAWRFLKKICRLISAIQRVHGYRLCQQGEAVDRQRVGYSAFATAAGRPEAAPPRHHARRTILGWEPQVTLDEGWAHRRVFSQQPRRHLNNSATSRSSGLRINYYFLSHLQR